MNRFAVHTFGCQMNVHDSRRIEEVLANDGWEMTEELSTANLVVFNTCSVREKAEHKLMSALGRVRPLKDERAEFRIVVAGCVAQQEGERLLSKAPYVDLVIGPDNIVELPALLERIAVEEGSLARTEFDLNAPSFLTARARANGVKEVTAFVTVMKGCDERCTFCVVPYTRGPERYRRADEIVDEIRGMVEGGTREVTLLGQTVNSWYEPEPDAVAEKSSQFASLLRRISGEVPGLERLRYTSPHPRHLTDALIDAHAELKVLPRHVHLPVQSGSDRVLKRMLRRYNRALYLERTRKLRARVPDLTLSTDFIVGFPGETEEDFEQTLSLVREVGFVAAFAFKYSPRPHTPALKLGDDVPEDVKSERLARLFEAVAEQQQSHLMSCVGRNAIVLFEGRSRMGDTFTGRTERAEIVHADGAGRDLTGKILPVAITSAHNHSLWATLAPETLASLPVASAEAKAKPSLNIVG